MQPNFKESALYRSCVAGTSIIAKRGNMMDTYTKINGSKFTRLGVEEMLLKLGWKKGNPLYFVQYGEGYFILKSKKIFSHTKGNRYFLNEDKIFGFIGRDLAESFQKEPFCKFFSGFSTDNGDDYLMI
jgi:hypothetical protein